MVMRNLITGWANTSSGAKLALGAGLVVAALVLMFVGHYISARFNLFHDSKFDAKIQEKIQQADELGGQVVELTKQHDEAIKRAEASEKREQDLVQQELLYKAAAETANNRAADAVGKIADEDKRFNEELQQTDNAVLDPCTRWLSNCARAQKLIKGFKGPCNCDQIQAAK